MCDDNLLHIIKCHVYGSLAQFSCYSKFAYIEVSLPYKPGSYDPWKKQRFNSSSAGVGI